jgi:hypothetical protein
LGALTIAFDTIIVGTLALPWVLLALYLFLPQDENHLDKLLQWVKDRELQTVAGILLFAMAYTLGSALSRIAQDFFNDDDLHVPRLFRMAMTEDRIIASVYCNTDYNHLLRAAAGSPTLTDKIKTFQCLRSNCNDSDGSRAPAAAVESKDKQGATPVPKSNCCGEGKDTSSAGTDSKAVNSTAPAQQPGGLCQRILSAKGRYLNDKDEEKENKLIRTARDIFGLQENALLLKGEDATLRLRQIHDQIMVLRGATFSGVLNFVFCLFAWGVRARREKPRSLVRWVPALVPALILYLAVSAFLHHIGEPYVIGPPYMEFSLLVIGCTGALLLWLPGLHRSGSGLGQNWLRWRWGALSLLFAVLTLGGLMGWWATEILYGQQVIYSYDSLSTASQK